MGAGPLTQLPQPLAQRTVYLVWENLRELSVPLENLLLVLSEEELHRATRFRLEDDRLRSQVAWGLLRMLLGRIIDKEPRAIEFTRNEFQKPLLQNGPSFSMAHSGEWVLLGVTAEGRLGVDVEAPRPIPNLDGLATTVFSTDELIELRTLPEADRRLAFYRGWTRKEAFVKAIGGGLSVPVRQFAVTLAPDVTQALRRVDLSSESGESWSVRPLPDLPDAISAVAWDRALEEVRVVDPASLNGK